MSTAPLGIRKFARKLVSIELEKSGSTSRQYIRACEKLRAPLVKLAGNAGFSSMLARALAVAKSEMPTNTKVPNNPSNAAKVNDETYDDFETWVQESDGEGIVLSELLWLLVSLIGQPLTISLVKEAWPNLTEENLKLITEVEP